MGEGEIHSPKNLFHCLVRQCLHCMDNFCSPLQVRNLRLEKAESGRVNGGAQEKWDIVQFSLVPYLTELYLHLHVNLSLKGNLSHRRTWCYVEI